MPVEAKSDERRARTVWTPTRMAGTLRTAHAALAQSAERFTRNE